MRLAKILCPTDFSAGSQQALRVAARMANETNAELVIAHASYLPPSAFAGEYAYSAHVIAEMADDARRALADAVAKATDDGVKHVRSKLLTGAPSSEIVALLETEPFELCVIGTHGRTGLSRILLGSIAEKVVRHAPCSVLVVRPDSEVRPFTHLLVPTDDSAPARCALERSAELVEPAGTITLLHVIEAPVAYRGEISGTDFVRDLDKRAMRALEEQAAQLRQTTTATVRARLRVGYPGAQILAALDDDRTVDVVVMGNHGRTGLARVLLGSIAEKIVRHAHRPVFVARRRA